jgi:xanthine dehydrogenase YagR molybdenum-binding subunit
MTKFLKMDNAQPRVLDETVQGLVSKPIGRVDGALKVTGKATYAGEFAPQNMAIGVMVRATITKGRVKSIEKTAVEAMPGILGVFSGKPLLRNPAQGTLGRAPVQPGFEIEYFGQPIAVVVAETFEQARHGALALPVEYEIDGDADVDPASANTVDLPEGDQMDLGDIDEAMANAAYSVDQLYSTPPHTAAPIEPHAALAEWNGDVLTVHGAYQMLKYNVVELADSLGIAPEKVRIVAPYVGGGFGSKLGISHEAVAAAVAARALGRPVRVVLSRQHVFEMTMRRSETSQRILLAADKTGVLMGLAHEDRVSNLPGEDFSEPTPLGTHFLYKGGNRRYVHEVALVNRTCAGAVRAPGEAVGMLALENAMDELAEAAGRDPVELRLRNIPEKHPENGLPFSSCALGECLTAGAEQFGWAKRKKPGEVREGEWFIGMGVATAARTNLLMASEARVTVLPDGTARVETDMTDIGTGTYTILAQIAAEMLGLPMDRVSVTLGDSTLPTSPGSGGSWGAASVGSSVFLAAQQIREKLAAKLGCAPADLTLRDGVVTVSNVQHQLADLIDEPLTGQGRIEPGEATENTMQAGFGAHFAEVAVNGVTGEVRVRRMLSVLAAGRILNELTAKSQAYGGQIWGIGSALTEEILHDPRDGRIVNNDFAGYHLPVNLDVPELEVVFLKELDDLTNPLQVKGIGELGISGCGAAVTNAIYNACGVRIRDYPATPDKIISLLPDGIA